MTFWLAIGPLKRGEPWAWWTLLMGGLATYGCFLTYLASDAYFDWSFALLVGIGIPLSIVGLRLTHRGMPPATGFSEAFLDPEIRGWVHTRNGRARLLIAALGVGIGSAGFGILAVASSIILVPQDAAFLRSNLDGLTTVNNRLAPLMAHDRAAYGGSMIAIGIFFTATALRSLGPDARGAKLALAMSGAAFYLSTIAIHFVIGYTSVVHLLPVYGGMTCLLVSLGIMQAKPPEPIPSTA